MRRSKVIIAALALAMTVAGCSSGGGSDSAGQSSAYRDTSNPSLPPIKVGAIAPVGSANSSVPDVRAGLAAGVLGVNARGGLNGHSVEMEFCNDQSDPNQGATCARRMVNDKVVAVLGMAGASSVQDQVQPILAAAGIPIIGSDAASTLMWTGKNLYMIPPPAPFLYQALIAYAVKQNLLPMAVVAADNPQGKQFATFLESTLKQLSGQGFATTVAVADNMADYAPVAGAVTAAHAKSVLNIIGQQQQLLVARAVYQQGSKAVMLDYASMSTTQMKSAGPAAGLIVTAGTMPPLNDPTLKQFRDDMAAQEATGDADAAISKASAVAPYGWLALQAVVNVTKGIDTITPETVSRALDTARDVDLSGIVPPWTPSAPGPEGFPRVSNSAVWLAAFKNGDFYGLADKSFSQETLFSGTFQAALPPGAGQ